ncbi:hypothetical protein [Actinacidiphila oryziradicis]
MDYKVPTAHEIPDIAIRHLETPCAFTETGAKGAGEGGTIGAPATVLNAVNDALLPAGVELDSTPITPETAGAPLVAVRDETPPSGTGEPGASAGLEPAVCGTAVPAGRGSGDHVGSLGADARRAAWSDGARHARRGAGHGGCGGAGGSGLAVPYVAGRSG